MKICRDCKFLDKEYYCFSPNNGVSMVTGKVLPKFAILNRGDNSKCGEEAKYFEEKVFEEKVIERKSPWYQFWNK